MKKKVVLIILLIIGKITFSYGQVIIKDSKLLDQFRSIPLEGLFVHHNASWLFAGERLYYGVYCLDLKAHKLSSLSKIAYVELIGKNGHSVFSHKIRLEDGKGDGDFFIPSSVPTGSYKLLGYTRWMRNGSKDYLFKSDIRILNPYQPVPEDYLEIPEVQPDSLLVDSLDPMEPKSAEERHKTTLVESRFVSLAISGKRFKKREKISLTLSSLLGLRGYGSYSLSVRKVSTSLKMSSKGTNIYTFPKEKVLAESNSSVAIPELRGELISGKLISVSSGEPVANKKVALSIPGKTFIFDIANTNDKGIFYFNLQDPYENEKAILQIFDKNKEAYKITIHTHSTPDSLQLEFDEFTLDRDLGDIILKRSVYNQIENAYARVRSDTIFKPKDRLPFYRNYQETYYLDDYTRFPTFLETLVEIIDHAWIKNANSDLPVFQVRPFDLYLDSNGLLPLVLIDGVFVQEHSTLLDYPAKKIRAISISRDRYLMGSTVFQGILAIETLSGNFAETFYKDYLSPLALFTPQPSKQYSSQKYLGDDKEANVPDFRYQLLWQPKLVLEREKETIDFYTSDVPGTYEIKLEGFTRNGDFISLRDEILVIE